MAKLNKIIRVRVSEEDIKLIGNNNLSKFIRSAIADKFLKEDKIDMPF